MTVCRCENVRGGVCTCLRTTRWGSGHSPSCRGDAASFLSLSLARSILADYVYINVTLGCIRSPRLFPLDERTWSHPLSPSSPASHPFVPRAVRQGEMVDNIEYCVNQTSDHVIKGWDELSQAEGYRKKARKVKNMRHQTHTQARGRKNWAEISFSP